MAEIKTVNLRFRYPQSEKFALDGISVEIEKGSFNLLCGKSGCGKSTLLRHFKKSMIPYGSTEGKVLFRGEALVDTDDRKSVSEIGFVQQNPDNQLVTDKVWHELAFGLESLGLDNRVIKRRVAEMASYFGIQTWFRKNTAELSGGQKQLLNLAAVMVMQPSLLILDEPTSQLDPIAAEEFLGTVYRINRELGTTVIISEHRLETLFTMADKVFVMDEGKILAADNPRLVGEYLISEKHPMFYGLPAVMKIYSTCMKEGKSPLTVREGRKWLEDNIKEDFNISEKKLPLKKVKQTVLSVNDLWFRYNKSSEDVLKGLSLNVNKAEFFAVLGGNGSGKSTLLKCMAGALKTVRGNIRIAEKVSMLPQNPQALFTEITVEEELLEALYYEKTEDDIKVLKVEEMLSLMEIEHLRKAHPYDLSGGEQQRLALGKILLTEPDILLLDEPTKGLDPFFKVTLANIFDRLKEKGKTLLAVSHDIEFCAEYADRCGMFFDGEIVSADEAREFFSGNNFYTTSANRMAGHMYPGGITWEEVALWAEENMKEKR